MEETDSRLMNLINNIIIQGRNFIFSVAFIQVSLLLSLWSHGMNFPQAYLTMMTMIFTALIGVFA